MMLFTSLAMTEVVVFPMLMKPQLRKSMNKKKKTAGRSTPKLFTSPVAALIQQVKIVPTPAQASFLVCKTVKSTKNNGPHILNNTDCNASTQCMLVSTVVI
jgi:hypothetical protein